MGGPFFKSSRSNALGKYYCFTNFSIIIALFMNRLLSVLLRTTDKSLFIELSRVPRRECV